MLGYLPFQSGLGRRNDLYRDLCPVAKCKYHRAIRTSNPHPINHRQPQGFIPFGEDEWPLPYIPYKSLNDFHLGEPFPLHRFQFACPLRRLAAAVEVAVVTLVEVLLV